MGPVLLLSLLDAEPARQGWRYLVHVPDDSDGSLEPVRGRWPVAGRRGLRVGAEVAVYLVGYSAPLGRRFDQGAAKVGQLSRDSERFRL